jgi:hypothetical protein
MKQYTRQYKRYPTQTDAHFALEDSNGNRQPCTIVNISRKGMGIIFHTDTEIDVGATIRVEVSVKGTSKSISATGTLKWFDTMDIDMIGGIELISELSDVQLATLDSSKVSLY